MYSRKILSFLFIAIFVIFSGTGRAQSYDFNQNCKNAYIKACDLKFDEARLLLVNERKKNPKNLIPLYVENTIDFLTLFIGEQDADFKRLAPNESVRLKLLDKGDAASPWHLYLKGEVLLQWAFTRLKFEEYITAASEIRSAYKYLEANNVKNPGFLPNKKGLGLLHVLIGSIPESYRWAANMAGVTGTISQGVSELTTMLDYAIKNPEYKQFETECIFLNTFIQLNLQNDNAGLVSVEKSISKYNTTNSPLLTYAKASILIKNGKNDAALNVLESYNKSANVYPFWYLEYLLGETYLKKLDVKAKSHFDLFLANFKGKNYIKSALLKCGWIAAIQNNKSEYFKFLQKIKMVGFEIVDEDKSAQKEAEFNVFPNSILLKSRLLCDGGYYQKSLAMMLNKKPSEFIVTNYDQIEYYYRLGRVLQNLERPDEAIKYYTLAYNSGYKTKWYFAANAMLQSGLISEKRKDNKSARSYFQKAIDLKGHDYENSIEQKAKAGLQRVK